MKKLKLEVAFVSLVPIAIPKGVKMEDEHENRHVRGTIIEPPFVYWWVAQ